MSLQTEYYRSLLLETHRGNFQGNISNVKPYLLLSIIDLIEKGIIVGNKILFNDVKLLETYNSISRIYEPGNPITPLFKPFFHLNREPFYYLKWKSQVKTPKQATTPSAKFIRENVEYACLDDNLWELLQGQDFRNEIRKALIQYFIEPRT